MSIRQTAAVLIVGLSTSLLRAAHAVSDDRLDVIVVGSADAAQIADKDIETLAASMMDEQLFALPERSEDCLYLCVEGQLRYVMPRMRTLKAIRTQAEYASTHYRLKEQGIELAGRMMPGPPVPGAYLELSPVRRQTYRSPSDKRDTGHGEPSNSGY